VELDDKNDRYERIVKISRDITIESKRIIFLLHTIDPRKDNRARVLEEAINRIGQLCDAHFSLIAKELVGLDQYQYARAFSPGLQEFIEAYTYYEYLAGSQISDWKKIQERLKFTQKASESEEDSEAKESICLVQPVEYILGLADLTGEIMRHCINSLGAGQTEYCFDSNKFLQNLLAYYLSINSVPHRSKDMSQKIFTLRQSTLKTEMVCYNVVVRGKEKSLFSGTDLKDPIGHDLGDSDVDEGFY
jgi:predicted translin family RNA/ssDNA-binding protein